MIDRARRFLSEDSGAGTIQALVVFQASLSLMGLAVDSTMAYNREAVLQVTADSAALAAAANMDDRQTAVDLAISLSELNMPTAANGSVITADNVRFGTYDFDTGAFTESLDSSDTDLNAVQVIAQRTNGNGNPVGTFVLGLVGQNSWDVVTQSIAVFNTGENNSCDTASFVSMGYMSVGGGASFYDGMCLHAQSGMSVGGGAYFEEGTRISAVSTDTIRVGGGSRGADLEDVIASQDLELQLLPTMDALFDAVWTEVSGIDGQVYLGSALPEQFQGMTVKVLTADTTKLKPIGGVWGEQNAVEWQPNTIYVTEGNVTTQGGSHANDFVIVSRGDVTIAGGGGTFTNTMFLSQGSVDLLGGNYWGDSTDFCNTGTYSTYMFAKDELKVAGGARLYGVVGAATTFNPGGGISAAGSVYFESQNDMALGGGYDLSGCEEPLESYYPIEGAPGIVGAYLVR